ncbi:deaminase domain-containing protein, partial [Serratia sp. CY66905]|uniref:deaminase domain-containing protein n=1 Tax=Serratia sp. CY66905 TaxID=3383661 RepID=UPI003F9ED9E3
GKVVALQEKRVEIAKGKVTIFTERVACDSCLGVVEQFQKKYPGVKVEVIDNNNILLIPRRLK